MNTSILKRTFNSTSLSRGVWTEAPSGDRPAKRRKGLRTSWIRVAVATAGVYLAAIAIADGSSAAESSKADEAANLQLEIKALNQRLLKLERDRAKAKALAEQNARGLRAPDKPAVTKAPGIPFLEGRPVRIIETSGTELTLYGLLEATFNAGTNATSDGKSRIGLTIPWFSGNRWGLYGSTMISPESNLKLIARVESEFELPTGDMDTPGVLFNRDAWVGFQSDDLGKFTVGRQDTLGRDFSAIWGDVYSKGRVTTDEGNYTNNNNVSQLIFYSGGGYGASGPGDTRLDNGIVWKKALGNGLVLGAAYAFSDGNGPGGPNGSGPIPGAGFGKGSVQSAAIGYNGDGFALSAFYNHTDVLEAPFIDTTTKGLSHQSAGIGGNYQFGITRFNLGYVYYTADQGLVGTRTDNAVTASIKITPPGLFDYELGAYRMFVNNAAYAPNGSTFVAYHDASQATAAGTGTRTTEFASVVYHPVPNIDLYVAADFLQTTGGYHAVEAHGHNSMIEGVTGVRWKF